MATFTVTNTNVSGTGSLAAAIAAANANPNADTITFASGVTTIFTPSLFTLTTAITFDGDLNNDGIADVRISGNNSHGVFEVSASANVTFDGVRLTDGQRQGAIAAGAVLNFGKLTLANCEVDGNAALGLGGSNGAAGQDGQNGGDAAGGIYNAGTLTITNTTFEGNSAIAGVGGRGGDGANVPQGQPGQSGGDGGRAGTVAADIINAAGATMTLNNAAFTQSVTVSGTRGGNGGNGSNGEFVGGSGGNGGNSSIATSHFANFGTASGSFTRSVTGGGLAGTQSVAQGGSPGLGGIFNGLPGANGAAQLNVFFGLTYLTDQANVYAGMDGDENIFGRGGDDILSGGGGWDIIRGGEGNDVLDGQAGQDELSGDGGNDVLKFSAGFSTILGGTGIDTLDLSPYAGGPVSVDLGDTNFNFFNGTDGLGLEGDIENAFGTNFGETITGSAVANTLRGNGGNDTLLGLDSDDQLAGGLGGDTLNGGAGFDYVRYDEANYGNLRISLVAPGTNTGTAAAGDTYTDIEGVIAGAGNDLVYGNGIANILDGRGGNDTLFGGLGADSLRGGDGVDYARYDDASYGNLVLSLANPSQNSGNGAAGDLYNSIEGFISGAGNDRIGGNGYINYLYGAAGNDTIAGNDGNDTLSGGAGLDIFVFNTAANSATNRDTILDFVAADDTIQIDRSVFANTLPLGTLSADRFHAGAAAADAGDRFIYNQSTGALYFDADGTGSAFALVHFATLVTKPAITNADLFIIA